MANRHDVQLRTQLLEKLFPSVDVVDNLDSNNPNRPLSARQGKVLKELIGSGGGGGTGLSIEVVNSLPTTGEKGILYLVPKSSYLKDKNKYDEYIWIESTKKYELLGSFSTDLNIEEYVDKFNSVLGEIAEINVATLRNNGINNYTTTGTYRVYGERINAQDGLPIINAANGHTVEGVLKVYNSSISGTGENTDKVVTQMLTMSNRTGADGHIWIRTGQGSNETNLTWSTWEKIQGIFEKNTITDISEINTFTTNGMYSCMYVGEDIKLGFSPIIKRGSTLLIIVINGYMASSIELNPQLTQSIILTQPGNNTNYIFTRHATFTNDSWTFNDKSNIVLSSALITDVNIGTVNAASINARINIGTYADSKVNINNAFIGKNTELEIYPQDSVVINKNVNIESNVFIQNGIRSNNDGLFIGNILDPEEPISCHIGNNIDISNNITIQNNIATDYIGTRGEIIFEQNSILFKVGDKTATIQLN